MFSTILRSGSHRRLGAALVLVAGLFALRSGEVAHATSGINPYVVPLVVDADPSPTVVETTIIADETPVDIGGGITANAMTFNGTLPGPQFRLNPGDTVIVHFENHLDVESCGIHWHGIELANASDGTPITQNQVPPGGTFIYKFIAPRPGIYWYHPHHHASTNQVFKGLYGSIVVTDPVEPSLIAGNVLPTAAETLTLQLSDITVCKAVGFNECDTYDDTLPHVSGVLAEQAGPFPCDLCENAPLDDEGATLPGPLNENDVPNIQKAGPGRTNEGQTCLTNGMNVGGRAGTPFAPLALAPGAATFNVQPGRGIRLQLLNTAVIRFFRLVMTTSTGVVIPLVQVGGQGGILDAAVINGGVSAGLYDSKYLSGEVLLDPGDRMDVVAVIPAAATGVCTLWTEDFQRTGQGPNGFTNIPTVPVAHFNVTGVPPGVPYTIAAGTALRTAVGSFQEPLGAATGTLLDPATFTPVLDGHASQDIQLTNMGGTDLGIDDVHGDHDFMGDYTMVPHFGAARYATLGDILQLTVTNRTNAHHPFHLHGFSIQPLSISPDPAPPMGVTAITGTYAYPTDFRDNVDVPGGAVLTFRVRLDDRPQMDGVTPGGALGRWIFHCHIFFHATLGMISEFVVLEPPDGNERPYVNSDATTVTVAEGDPATMTGTYFDPDGDPVTLSGPALGTLVDNLDGTWSWSHTPSCGPDSEFLYVTATDSFGHTDVAVFQMIVTNVAPAVTATASRRVLWPATKGLLDVGLSIVATDPCDPTPDRAVKVYSDETAGVPPYAPDASVTIVPPLPPGQTFALKCRAERLVPGNGRIYVLSCFATDLTATTAHNCVTVVVPQVLTTGHLATLLLEADAAEASCDASLTGTPSAPWNNLLLDTVLPPP